MILGSTSVSLYAMLFGFMSPIAGPWIGGAVCWVFGIVFASAPSYFYLQWRRRSSTKPEVTTKHSEIASEDVELVLANADTIQLQHETNDNEAMA